MSQVDWFPRTTEERKTFFVRTFPIFVALVVFLYFGLDWLGAFEFLEVLVRDSSIWLLKVIFGVDEANPLWTNRRDLDPLYDHGLVIFSEYFP